MSDGRGAKDARATKVASPSARSGARAPIPPSDIAADFIERSTEEDFDPRIGTLLGEHYRILERLGAGGMGTVYLVVHIHLKKKFAAKILNDEAARRPDALARFQQEAVSASRLDHENIVDIVNFGASEDGTVYLVMEFLRGEALNQILDKGPLGIDDAVRVTVPICRALAAAHGAGIVHRDLKPENVFVARRSGGGHIVKILDFGVSKIKADALAERRLTQSGDVLGSPLYMSPEASRGEADVDGRADLYAVGVMLFEMLVGTVPFTADNYLQVLYKHIQEPPPSPRSLQPDISPAVERVILTALAKDPGDRYPNMEELEAALIAAAPGIDVAGAIGRASPGPTSSGDVPAMQSGGHGVAAPIRTAPRGPSQRSRWAVAAGFLATLAALLVGALYLVGAFTSPGSSSSPGPSPILTPSPNPLPSPPPDPTPSPDPSPSPMPPPLPTPAVLTIDSDPAGADVRLDGTALGKTPLVIPVTADHREHLLRVELAGFRPESRPIVLDRDRAIAVALKRRERERPRPSMDIKEGR